jgi:4-amino-4-deoxy-L-arabinose transferase-like glycosyltransferase
MSYLFAIKRLPAIPPLDVAIPAVLAIGTATLYLSGLAASPQYALRDEMYFAVTAHSIAASGHDPSGHLLPVYFPIGPVDRPLMWFQPMLMYGIAALLKVLPFDLFAIRLPMAIAGVVNVVLTYAVALSFLKRRLPAIAAATMLAIAPAHFLFSRSATDYLLPVPFILAWLWCVIRYLETGTVGSLIGAALVLGAGLYTLIASYILMPIYALLTAIVLWTRRSPRSRYAILACGVIGPALIGIAFVIMHPEMLSDIMSRYEPARRRTTGGSAAAAEFMATRLSNLAVYGSFWNPELLAIDGRGMLTGAAGVFALPMLGVMFIGVARSLVERHPIALLLTAGLITAPLPASLVNEPGAIRRALEMLPFAALLAAYGLDWVWSPSSLVRRTVFVLVCVATVLLSVQYRPQLPLAQAYIRAATLPLIILAIAIVLGRLRFETAPRQPVTFAVLGLVAITFVYFYVDFLFARRMGPVPATVIAWLSRALAALGVALLAWLCASWLSNTGRVRWWSVVLTVAALELAYFYVDRSTAFLPRFAHVALVASGVLAVAWYLKNTAIVPQRLGELVTVALLAIGSIQFAQFYRDYWGAYRERRASAHEGSTLLAFDAVLERADLSEVPALYLANPMERADVRDIFWKFAVLRHHRESIFAKTISEPGVVIDAERANRLAAHSIVLSGAGDANAQTLIDQGHLRVEQIVTAADGIPTAWILRRTDR